MPETMPPADNWECSHSLATVCQSIN